MCVFVFISRFLMNLNIIVFENRFSSSEILKRILQLTSSFSLSVGYIYIMQHNFIEARKNLDLLNKSETENSKTS